MSDNDIPNSEPPAAQPPEPKCRVVGGTEYSWCKAVPLGTGVTVLGLLLSKPPDLPLLQNALHNLQNSHPILRSKLHYDPTTTTFSFLTPTNPQPLLQIQPFDLQSTSRILQTHPSQSGSVTPFRLIVEYEINNNTTWRNPEHPLYADKDVMYASVYALSEAQWALTLRLHTSACDRTAAVSLLRELLEFVTAQSGYGEGVEREIEDNVGVNFGIEQMIPAGKANKPFWARGIDMLGYSLNSFRLSNLDFIDVDSPKRSQLVRLQMTPLDTQKLLAGCKSRGIKLCAALAAAGLIAAYSSKKLPDHQREKYAVVTLIDCRSILDPVLSSHHIGFYHSAITNSHDISAEEQFWELANRCYTSFANAKNSNKHFSDMSDLNFLMCKAIENPTLTPSSSMRTALVSVFEDPIDDSSKIHQQLGVEDYVGCASAHGVGPSIAIFDTIRNGGLDCTCVYPSPLHSRDQMQGLIDDMRRILVDACNQLGSES
ncbi:hypothetical protein RGQ29_025811 [Quercus rubra]|uniref:Uncharacterized protein n=1 Tax=Quercus rubra TaxID=3512 RepID=A0AAN7EZ89_QUERU|nr:hypothetical protein RGQ29_025811 [Quercus rubra]